MKGTTITLSQREVKLLRKKLAADAEWDLHEVSIAEDILTKLRCAEVPRGR